MQNFMFKCSKLTSDLKKNHYLMLKRQKTDFGDFGIGVKESLSSTVRTSNFKGNNLLSYLKGCKVGSLISTPNSHVYCKQRGEQFAN